MNFPDRVTKAFQMGINDTDAANAILDAILTLRKGDTVTEYDDSPVILFDGSLGNWHGVILRGDREFDICNVKAQQEFSIRIVQGAPGSHLVTWFTGIHWPGGVEPKLTKKAGGADIFRFKQFYPDYYYGSIVGQGYQS